MKERLHVQETLNFFYFFTYPENISFATNETQKPHECPHHQTYLQGCLSTSDMTLKLPWYSYLQTDKSLAHLSADR